MPVRRDEDVMVAAVDQRSGTGLPDGWFSNQKSEFGYILEGLGMKKVGIFYSHFEYIATIW
jgi:hypothetical protein